MSSLTVALQQLLLCLLIGSAPGSPNSIRDSLSPSDGQIEIQSATPSNQYIAHPDIGVALKVHNNLVSWIVAREECRLEGGYLAVIDSFKKLGYVLRQRQSNDYTHVGIIRMYDDAVWIRLDSVAPIFSIPWGPGEPAGSYDCVMISKETGRLTNRECTTLGNYVCEIQLPPNYTAQGDSALGQISAN